MPAVMVTLLLPFERLFDPRTWRKAQLLAMGAILSPGKRTVSSALNILGIAHGDFAIYHHVLNRGWSPLQLSRALAAGGRAPCSSSTEPLMFGIDETVERRWGRKIAAKGRYRDPVRSDDQVVMTPGLQWVSRDGADAYRMGGSTLGAAVFDRAGGVGPLRPTQRPPAQDVHRLRPADAGLPAPVAAGEGPGGGGRWRLRQARVPAALPSMSKPIDRVTKLRKDASLYQPAPPRRPGQIGRPRVVGARLPSPTAVLDDPATQWIPYRATGSDGSTAMVELASERSAVVPRRAAAPSHTLGRHQIPGGAPRALCFAMHRHRGGTPADTAGRTVRRLSGICCGGRSR